MENFERQGRNFFRGTQNSDANMILKVMLIQRRTFHLIIKWAIGLGQLVGIEMTKAS